MMRKLFLFSLISLTTFSAHAEPIACPDSASIKMVYFDEVMSESNGLLWGGYIRRNHFGSDVEWSFSFAYAPADDALEARKLLNTELQKITFDYQYGGDDYTVCNYTANDKYQMQGMAIHPPLPY